MGWFTDYLEKLSLIDYAASKMNPAQKPSPFLWKPFSRRSREAYYAEQERLHAMRKKWADEMRSIMDKGNDGAKEKE